MSGDWMPDLVNLTGVVLISVLLVWRIDVRMAAVERAVQELCTVIGQLVGKTAE